MSEQERDEKLGGEIALGLVLLGGICAFPLALLADRFSRKLLLVVICVEINHIRALARRRWQFIASSTTSARAAVPGSWPNSSSITGADGHSSGPL